MEESTMSPEGNARCAERLALDHRRDTAEESVEGKVAARTTASHAAPTSKPEMDVFIRTPSLKLIPVCLVKCDCEAVLQKMVRVQ